MPDFERKKICCYDLEAISFIHKHTNTHIRTTVSERVKFFVREHESGLQTETENEPECEGNKNDDEETSDNLSQADEILF